MYVCIELIMVLNNLLVISAVDNFFVILDKLKEILMPINSVL